MGDAKIMDERERRIWQGRLFYAIVSARAKECPNRKCGRKGYCLARFGQKELNFHTKIGACRNMSEAEWRIVSLGMCTNYIDNIEPLLRRRDDARDALKPQLSWEEEKRRWWSAEEVTKRAEANCRREAWRGEPYWYWLWLTVRGDEICLPSAPQRLGEALIRDMAARRCRCAQERALACSRNAHGEVVVAHGCEDGLAAN